MELTAIDVVNVVNETLTRKSPALSLTQENAVKTLNKVSALAGKYWYVLLIGGLLLTGAAIAIRYHVTYRKNQRD